MVLQGKKQNSRAIPARIDEARQVIIDNLPIGDYILKENLVYDLDVSGDGDGKMVCPVHNDHKPSCIYNVNKNVYHCFACGSKGSVVELDVGKNKRVDDTYNAVKSILKLAREYNIEIPSMFEYGTSRKPVRTNVSKRRESSPEQREKVALRKLERLESKVRSLPNNVRLTVYNNCDRVLLGEISATEMVVKIEKYLKSLN